MAFDVPTYEDAPVDAPENENPFTANNELLTPEESQKWTELWREVADSEKSNVLSRTKDSLKAMILWPDHKETASESNEGGFDIPKEQLLAWNEMAITRTEWKISDLNSLIDVIDKEPNQLTSSDKSKLESIKSAYWVDDARDAIPSIEFQIKRFTVEINTLQNKRDKIELWNNEEQMAWVINPESLNKKSA